MFEGIFNKNQPTKIKQAEPTPQRRQFFSGIFSNKNSSQPTTTIPVEEKPKTFKVSPSLGGGEFNLPANKLTTSTRSQDALGPTKEGAERDHIISVALGGTSNRENLQYLEDNKSWINKILGRETTLAERQQGKILIEQKLINDFKDNKISLAEARGKLLQYQRQIQGLDPKQGTAPYIVPAVKETVQEAGNKAGGLFKGIFKKATSLDDLKSDGIDPALRTELIKRGETDKLKELEQAELDKMGLKDFRPVSTDQNNIPTTRAEQEQKFAEGLNNSRAGKYFSAVSKNAKKQVNDVKLLFTDPKQLAQDPMIKGFDKDATPEERKYAEEKLTNLTLAASTMPLKDISASAIRAIETKLGTKLSQVDKEGVLNYLKGLKESKGLAMVDVEPNGPVFKDILSKVEKNEPIALEAKPVESPIIKSEPLLGEAKKYKSAEEFVSNQKSLFRGHTDEGMLKDRGRGISFATTRDVAERFAKTDDIGFTRDGKVGEFYLLPEAKVLDASTLTPSKIKGDMNRENVIKYAKANGYDAIDMTKAINPNTGYKPENEIRILNRDILKTKSQLTDIWNEANKVVEPKPVVNNDIPFESINPERVKQIKGYKNAKEFEDSFSVRSPEMDEGSIPGANFFKKVGQAAAEVKPKVKPIEADGTAIFKKLGQASRTTGMSSVQEILQNKNRVKPQALTIETAFHERGMQQARKYVEDKYTRAESRGFADAKKEFSRALKNDTFVAKLKQFWEPVKNQDKKTQDIFRQWARKKLVGRELANQELPKLEIPNKEGWDVMVEYEKGGETPYSRDIKREFDSLYREAKKRGLDVPYRDNYLPHVYDNDLEEIKTAMSKYMTDQGVDPQMVQDYVDGIKDIPEEVVRALKLNPSFVKSRAFPDYETALKYDLRPKYTNPAQLLAHYRNDLEQTIANNEFLNALIREGKIFPFEVAPRDFVAVNIPFSGGGYFAEPRLAEMLNGIFRDDNFLNLGQWTAKSTAWLSKTMQEIALSAGVPKTQVNFFSMGQLFKELHAGNIGVFRTYARANFNGPTARYFEKNAPILKEMAEEGVDLGGRIGSYGRVFENLKRDKGLIKWFGRGWETWFNEKPFNSLLPQLYTETYKNARVHFLKSGMGLAEAKATAADVVRNFYGVYEDIGRGKTNEDVISSLFFAPKFREGIMRSLWNVGKAGVDLVTSVGGIRKPLNPALYKNRRLLVGMILSFIGYNLLNKKLSGHYMLGNPNGKELELMVPRKNGDVVYIPFMPSYLAFARNMVTGLWNLGKGDFDTAKQKLGSLTSAPLKLVSELWANQDFFGRPIWKESYTTGQKLKEAAKYSGLQVLHPFLREAYKWLSTDKPGYQALSEAMELPFKFSTMDAVNKGLLIRASKKRALNEKREMDRVRPIYDKALKLYQEGKKDESTALWNTLSEEDKLIFKKIKTDAQAQKKKDDTEQAQANMLPLVERLQKMRDSGQEQEARDIWAALSDEEKEIYAETRKKAGY